VKRDEVQEIVVKGSTLEIHYNDETRKEGVSKKENDAAITETLANLGVTTSRSHKSPSMFRMNLVSDIGFQILHRFFSHSFSSVFIIWFFTRSVKGAGMQALELWFIKGACD
jgi:hypothetical protein